ncbi:hypothetical protein TIFTF001_011175 [Ficus carica]|uniref:Uncharacterized protein n=1 Tax=Ficus carica TaxID=3494 RepID=A0AA87ZT08_FICCA|nr:hypothetical protein TIFTF001_011175 [Ficus carica]
MDFLKSLSGGSGDKPAGEVNKGGDHHQNPSTTELLSSAKEVASAARLAASNQSDKIDKGKAAGAAADLLDATSGKLGDKGVGQHLQKAEDYLRQYEAKNTGAGAGAGHAKRSEEGHEAGGGGEKHKPESTEHHEDQKKNLSVLGGRVTRSGLSARWRGWGLVADCQSCGRGRRVGVLGAPSTLGRSFF